MSEYYNQRQQGLAQIIQILPRAVLSPQMSRARVKLPGGEGGPSPSPVR
jgi:hypothetical protein